MNMFPQVRDILAKQLRIADVDTITPESRIMDDLGADSLVILQLLMKIEDDYGIMIPDEELVGFTTVGDVVAYLDKQQAK
ncbi:MAG: acyl carrier protein [Bacteroidales bacterium]|nr:acyl carrier protein [Bacteroidales bacterium]